MHICGMQLYTYIYIYICGMYLFIHLYTPMQQIPKSQKTQKNPEIPKFHHPNSRPKVV